MIKFFFSLWGIISSLIIFIATGLIWYLPASKENEAEATVALISTGIIFFTSLIGHFINEIDKPKPKINLKIEIDKNNPKRRKVLGSSDNNPILEDGSKKMYGDGGLIISQFYWHYKLILNNTSSQNAFDLEILEKKNVNIKVLQKRDKHNLKSFETIEFNFHIMKEYEEKGNMQSKLYQEKSYPDELQQLQLIAKYKDESGNVFYTYFSFSNFENHNNFSISNSKNLLKNFE